MVGRCIIYCIKNGLDIRIFEFRKCLSTLWKGDALCVIYVLD